MEGGRPTTSHYDVVRMAFLLSARERDGRVNDEAIRSCQRSV
jgi:hypothetical protein